MKAWFDEHGRLRLGWRIALAFLVSLWVNRLAVGIAAGLTQRERLLDAIYRPLLAVLLILSYSLLLLFADRAEKPVAAMGLWLHRGWGRQFALGGALGGGMIATAVLAIAAFGHLSFFVRFNGHVAELVAVELFVLLSGALAEELLFRGYPFQRLIDGIRFLAEEITSGRVSPRLAEDLAALAAAVMLSLLFGAAHLWNPHSSNLAFFNTVAVGILLSFAYLRTRGLWLPWGIHFAWNTVLGLGFGLPVSGLTDFSVVVHGQAQGPQWLTGGAYGVEASAVGTAVIVLGFVPLFLLTRRDHAALAVAAREPQPWTPGEPPACEPGGQASSAGNDKPF